MNGVCDRQEQLNSFQIFLESASVTSCFLLSPLYELSRMHWFKKRLTLICLENNRKQQFSIFLNIVVQSHPYFLKRPCDAWFL